MARIELKLKKEITNKLVLPKDIMYGLAIVKIVGQSELYIENHRGIIEYNNDKIVIQTKSSKIEIIGKNLLIVRFSNDDMKINGNILEIKYLV